MQRRAWLALVAAAASLAGLVAPASGQAPSDFPSRPISLIVPFQAGVSADLCSAASPRVPPSTSDSR